MGAIVLVVAGDLDTRTGGSIYNRRMAESLCRLGWTVDVRELYGGFPQPTPDDVAAASRLFAGLPAGATVVVDGLAFSALPDIAMRESARLRLVALIHLPIASGAGLDLDTAARFEAAEARALGAATMVIVTGAGAVPLLERYGLPAQRVVVVEPGTDSAPLARGSGGPPHLLCVATLNPGKGHELLLGALSDVRSSSTGASAPAAAWRLTCAGSLTRSPGTAAGVRTLARDLGLHDRVSFAGDLDTTALGRCYDTADLFVLATEQETYGMAVAEALAHGLPVVSTTTGAIASLVGGDAGLLVRPGDRAALAAALSRAIGEAPLRARWAEGARRARERLPSWDTAAGRLATVLETVHARG